VMTEVHVPPGTNELQQVNVNLIVFKNFLICVHQGPIKCVDQVLNRMRMLKEGMKRTADWIMYAILDAIVDMFFSFVQHIAMEVDSLDDLVLILTAHEQNDVLKRIGLARKRISFLRAQLLKKKDVMVSLMIKSTLTEDETEVKATSDDQHHGPQHDDSPTLEKFDLHVKHRVFGALNRNTKIYLRDVLDHIQAMLEDIEATKETLSNLNSTYLARVDIEVAYSSNRMDSVMKKFGAMTTIMLPLTFITGLWGMNVNVPGQPETEDFTWFYVILGGMAAYSAIVIILFKKYHWF
jgi:Mg2+ and Co2+ transporter CorA